MLYALTFTSNNASQRALGKRWFWLHSAGIYTLVAAFTVAYLGKAVEMGGHYWGWGALGMLAFILRFYHWRNLGQVTAPAQTAPQ